MNPPDDELLGFLRGVREFREPADADKQRVRSALRHRLPRGAFGANSTRPEHAKRTPARHKLARVAGLAGALLPLSAAAKLGGAKVLLGTLIVVGVGTGAALVVTPSTHPGSVWRHGSTTTPDRHSVRAPLATQVAPSPSSASSVKAEPERTESEAPGQGGVSKAQRAPTASTLPASSAPTLRDEVALLRQAERARRGGDAATSLRLLAEMDRRFPRSSLTQERLTASVLSHCDLGQAEAAMRAAARLHRDFPATVHSQRLRSSCVSAKASFEDE
jgi:hypothetical protein